MLPSAIYALSFSFHTFGAPQVHTLSISIPVFHSAPRGFVKRSIDPFPWAFYLIMDSLHHEQHEECPWMRPDQRNQEPQYDDQANDASEHHRKNDCLDNYGAVFEVYFSCKIGEQGCGNDSEYDDKCDREQGA